MNSIGIIGLGNIGSSVCGALRRTGFYTVYGYDINTDFRTIVTDIGCCHKVFEDICQMVQQCDIVILATPVSTYGDITATIAPHLVQGAILSDVGSVKQAVIADVSPHVPDGVYFVPAHPIAGTEKSGPTAGFAELFENRYTIICPIENTDTPYTQAVETLTKIWQNMGATVDIMDALHHDQALAIISHIPHLLGFTLVGSARHLENINKAEIIKYSAGGFRDATRVAGSDPIMWRDIFLNNTDSVRQVLSVFKDDLNRIEKYMQDGDGQALYDWFLKTREIRQAVIDAGQATQYDPTEDNPLPSIGAYNTDG